MALILNLLYFYLINKKEETMGFWDWFGLGLLWGINDDLKRASKEAEIREFEEAKLRRQAACLEYGLFDLAEKVEKAKDPIELRTLSREYYYRTREKWLKEDIPEKENEWRPVLDKIKKAPVENFFDYDKVLTLAMAELAGRFGKKYGPIPQY